jgi:hypothetical protein
MIFCFVCWLAPLFAGCENTAPPDTLTQNYQAYRGNFLAHELVQVGLCRLNVAHMACQDVKVSGVFEVERGGVTTANRRKFHHQTDLIRRGMD